MHKVGDVYLKIKAGWILQQEKESGRMFVESIDTDDVIELTADEFKFVRELFGKRLNSFNLNDHTYGWVYPERMKS